MRFQIRSTWYFETKILQILKFNKFEETLDGILNFSLKKRAVQFTYYLEFSEAENERITWKSTNNKLNKWTVNDKNFSPRISNSIFFPKINRFTWMYKFQVLNSNYQVYVLNFLNQFWNSIFRSFKSKKISE